MRNKILLLLLAALLLAGVGRLQNSLNADRDALGLTRVTPLENAPPVLAFTTVALGGFRGLISNMLWIRASDLQDDDKFFEMAQLADWITKLEPHFVQVWLVQSWNMAYNISVKFTDFKDRWRWVKRGIELLRDEGIPYNPNATLLYRELAWFFQHKMGANLDDANMYYKQQWSEEMAKVFAKKKPNLQELIHPQNDDQRARARLLRETYKMDPELMAQVDERYGPLEWRLPEAHAIYWAALGLKKAQEHPAKINKDDLITLRRVIYQSMQTAFQRGRLVADPFIKQFEFGPNLDIIPKVSAAYEQAAEEDAENHDHILRAHRNFLRDAVYFLYEHNRMKDAAYWFSYLSQKYPSQPIIDNQPNSFPRNLTLDQYAVGRIKEDIGETSRDRVKSAIEGLLTQSYLCLVKDGEEDRSTGLRILADKVWEAYTTKTQLRNNPAPTGEPAPIALPPVSEIAKAMLDRLLDPQRGLLPEGRALLRVKLQMPPEIAPAPGTTTNTPPETAERLSANPSSP